MRHLAPLPLLIAGALALAACGGGGERQKGESTGAPSNDTLIGLVGVTDNLADLADVIGDAQIGSALDAQGSYTLLAPDDDAFRTLDIRKDDLTDGRNRPLLVAALRHHLLPGYVTVDAIRSALADRDSVQMRTMGGGTVTFFMRDGSVRVRGVEGEEARLSGHTISASNGVILPLDGFIAPLPDEVRAPIVQPAPR